MKENQKYRAIQKILQKVSLTRRDADWEKMNSLLNSHLPVKAPHFNPIHSVKLWAYAGSIALVTTATVLTYTTFHRADKQKRTTFNTNRIQNTDSAFVSPLAGTDANGSPESSPVVFGKEKNKVGIFSDTLNSMAAGPDENISLTGKRHEAHAQEMTSQGSEELHAARLVDQRQTSDAIQLLKNVAGSEVRAVESKDSRDLNIFISEQIIAQMASEKVKHDHWVTGVMPDKKQSSANVNISAGKKSAGNHMTGRPFFSYGFSLPLLQYYTSNPDQTFQLNYIPGLTGQYSISNHWAIGMNLFPYQKIPLNDRDSVYSTSGRDSSVSLNNSYLKKYYLNSLNSWAAEIHLDYQFKNGLGMEAGLGLQGVWNAKGYVTTVSSDSIYNQPNFGNSTHTQNMRYSSGDPQLAGLQKTNVYYYLGLVYHSEKWSVSLNYNQNGKTWLSANQAKSPAWIKLQFNYFFNH